MQPTSPIRIPRGSAAALACAALLLTTLMLGLVATGGRAAAQSAALTVVVSEADPFVERRGDDPDGFFVEIWEEVAERSGHTYEYQWVDGPEAAIAALESGDADVAVVPFAATSEREARIDFTAPILSSGPQIGVHERLIESTGLLRALFNGQVFRLLAVALVALFVLANTIWFVERHNNPDNADFDARYLPGLWDAFWWATVTVTTVGYGDIAPKSVRGRMVAIVAMFTSLFVVGAFVSQVTTRLAEGRAVSVVQTLDDARERTVGVVAGTAHAAFLETEGLAVRAFESQAQLLAAMASGEIDVTVADTHTLAAAAAHDIVPVGDVLYEEFAAFGLPQDSMLQEPLDRAIADLRGDGSITRVIRRWSD